MMAVLTNVHDTWLAQTDNCQRLDINNRSAIYWCKPPSQPHRLHICPRLARYQAPARAIALIINNLDSWWRIPLYLLCSATCLGQYRFPIVNYWRGLIVQLVAYEVQFQVGPNSGSSKLAEACARIATPIVVPNSVLQRHPQLLVYWESRHDMDNMDYATSNLMGAMAAVVAAFILTFVLIETRKTYYGRLLHRNMDKAPSCFSKCCYCFISCCVHICDCLKIERTSEKKKLQMRTKLKERLDAIDRISNWETADTSAIELEAEEERVSPKTRTITMTTRMFSP